MKTLSGAGITLLIVLLAACSAPDIHQADSQAMATGAPPGAGEPPAPTATKSIGYQADPEPLRPAIRPDGLTTIVVPSIVVAPRARYLADPRAPEVELKPFEIPVVGQRDLLGHGGPPKRPTVEKLARPMQPRSRPLSDASGATVRAPSLTSSFDTAHFNDNPTYNDGFLFIPPDPIGAAGPDHLVNVVNNLVQFHQKDGTPDATFSLRGFFADLGPETYTFDPKVIYDQYADRFIVITLETVDASNPNNDTSWIFVAVSDDANPNGFWTVTAIDSKVTIGGQPRWADYPGLAIDEEAVYITANMFNFAGTSYGGVRLWVIDKGLGSGGFYDGGTASVSILDPYGGPGIATTTQPAHIFGTAPTSPNVGTFLVSYSGLTGGGNESLQVIRLDNPLTSPAFTQAFVGLGDIETLTAALPDAPQLGTTTAIEVNDRRALHSVWRDNSLWTATTIGQTPTGPNETSAYWVEIDTTTLGSLVVADQGAISGEDIATGAFTFFPSIAVTGSGEVGIGFSASAGSIYPGSFYTTRSPGDTPGSNSGSAVLRTGLDFYVRTFGGPRNRWGDYSGIAVDPNDECFWIYNEHALARGTPISGEDGRWGTAFGRACMCDETLDLGSSMWKQFSLPCNPGSDNKVADVLGNLAGIYGINWVVYRFDAVNGGYAELALNDPIELGTGYWIGTDTPSQSVEVQGVANQPMEVPLQTDAAGRFNKVGHPFDFDVCWADAQVIDGASVLSLSQADPNGDCEADPIGPGCIMSRVAHKWTGASYASFNGTTPGSQGTLVPWDGFWVKAFKPGIKLRIPATPGNCGAPAIRAPKSPRMAWHVRLTARQDDRQDDSAVFGQYPGSKKTYDMHDLEELSPFGSPYLTVLFPHPDWKQHAGDYATDFHPATRAPVGDQWDFEVRASEIGQPVVLSWTGPRGRLRRAILIDRETGRLVHPGKVDSYTFMPRSATHRFRWLQRP